MGQYLIAENTDVLLEETDPGAILLNVDDASTQPVIDLSISNRRARSVVGGDAVTVRNGYTSTFGNVCYDGSAVASMAAEYSGIVVSTSGDGDTVITVDHSITAGNKAIDISHGGVGDVTLTANGELTGQFGGIVVQQMGIGDIDITATRIIAALDREADPTGIGIAVTQLTEHQTTIRAGDIYATKGIDAYTAGPISIALTGILASTSTGIELRGDGPAEITISGSIDSAQTAILFGSGENTLTLEPGYAIAGLVDASAQVIDPNTNDSIDSLDDTLIFGGTGSGAFDIAQIGSQYLGFDTFRKTGASTWTFSGSATSPLQLVADEGIIKIDDQTTGLDVILSGTATIGGIGRIQSLSLNGGTLAPGNSIGTLNVAGDATIGAGTTYTVEVDAAGNSDRLIVGGVATIETTQPGVSVVIVPEAGIYKAQTTYTILTASTINGDFVEPPTVTSPFFDPTLSRDSTNVYLTLTRNDATVADQGQTSNQTSPGAAIDSAGAAAPHLPEILVLLAPEIPAALSALSGDGYASLITAAIDSGSHLRSAAFARRGSGGLWTRPYGRFATLPGDGNGPAVNSGSGGIDIGIEQLIGHNQIGVLLGYGETSFALPGRDLAATSGEFSLGAHGSIWWDDTYLSLGASATARRMTVTRKVIFTGVSDSYAASFTGLTLEGFTELGHSFRLADTRVTPFGGLAAIESLSPGFTESGAGPAPLTVAASGTAALVTTLGVRIEHELTIADRLPLLLSASAAWQHSFGGTATLTNRLANGPAFTVTGAPLPTNTLLLNAAAEFTLSPNLSIALTYAGTLASHTLSATLAGRM